MYKESILSRYKKQTDNSKCVHQNPKTLEEALYMHKVAAEEGTVLVDHTRTLPTLYMVQMLILARTLISKLLNFIYEH